MPSSRKNVIALISLTIIMFATYVSFSSSPTSSDSLFSTSTSTSFTPQAPMPIHENKRQRSEASSTVNTKQKPAHLSSPQNNNHNHHHHQEQQAENEIGPECPFLFIKGDECSIPCSRQVEHHQLQQQQQQQQQQQLVANETTTTIVTLTSSNAGTISDQFVQILPDFPCFNGCRCPAPKCMLSLSSPPTTTTTPPQPKCVLSPFYLPPSPQDQEKQRKVGNELICTGEMEVGDRIPSPPVNDTPLNTSFMHSDDIEIARIELLRFKRATSWMFSRWFDWGENIAYGGKNAKRIARRNQIENVFTAGAAAGAGPSPVFSRSHHQHQHHHRRAQPPPPRFVKPLDGGQMVGRHVHDTNKYFGLYVWTNVCFRSEGNVMGFEPKITQYKGRSELESVATKSVLQHMTVFIATVDRLPSPPKYVLEMNCLVIGVDWKADNSGHVLYRAIAARRIGEKLWGGGGGEEREGRGSRTSRRHAQTSNGSKTFSHSSPSSSSSGSSAVEKDDDLDEEEHGLRAPAPFHVIYVILIENSTDERDVEGHKYFGQLVGHSWSVVVAVANKKKNPSQRKNSNRDQGGKNDVSESSSSSSSSSSWSLSVSSLESRRAHFGRKFQNGDVPYSPEEMHKEILDAATTKSSIPFTCFKEVVVYHVCLEKCRYSVKERPGNGFMFPYIGRHLPIHSKIIRRFRKVIANCISPSSKTPTTTTTITITATASPLRITLLARTKSRIDYGLARAVPMMNQQLQRIFASSSSKMTYKFQVIAQHEHTPNSFFKILLESDIVIGSMGGSLSFGSWMIRRRRTRRTNISSNNNSNNSSQEEVVTDVFGRDYDDAGDGGGGGGVVVEIVGTSACAMNRIGWGLAPKCDFGGAAQSAGHQHFVIALPRHQSAPKILPTPGIYVGTELYQKLILLAVCKKMMLMMIEMTKVKTTTSIPEICLKDSSLALLEGDLTKKTAIDWKFATWKQGVDS